MPLVGVRRRVGRPPAPPPGGQGSLLRKPSYPTPEPPTPLRTFYVDAAGGSDSNNGSIGSPFQTIGKINSHAQPGDRFYLKGTFTGTTSLAGSGNSGTLANPIQVMKWPGETVLLNNGGGASENNPVGANNRHHWWLQGLTIQAAAGAYGPRGIAIQWGSSNWTVIDCHLINNSLVVISASDNRFYDCSITGTYGSEADNAGDFFDVSNGSHRNFFARLTVDGYARHSAGLIGNVQAGAATADDNHFFDCYFRNLGSGGPQFLGYSRRGLMEWCTIVDSGTDASTQYYVGSKESVVITAPETVFRFNVLRGGATHGIFHQSYVFGGVLGRASECLVHHNVIYGHQGAGIYLYAGPTVNAQADLANNVFENNIAWDNQRGSQTEGRGYLSGWNPIVCNLYNTEFPWTSGSIAGNIFRNNCSARSTADTVFLGIWKNVSFGQGGNTFYSHANFESTFGSVGCVNNIAATNPLMVDPAANNFRLQSGSPCIDTGIARAGIGYLGSAPDIGAFEFGGDD